MSDGLTPQDNDPRIAATREAMVAETPRRDMTSQAAATRDATAAHTGDGTGSEEMTGAQMVVRALVDQGVTDLFGYPGGAVLPIYDALFRQPRLKPHPGAPRAGRGPCGGRLCPVLGKGGVVLVTSGPGATNVVTGSDRRAARLHPAGLHHRPGADAPDRH